MPNEIEHLYREHRAALVRLVERELHDQHDAEDVVQTAFLDAQRALERGTIPHNPRAWLATIALNAGRRLRRRSMNAEPLEEYAVHEASGAPEIRAALANLPREQRTAVVYRDLLGFSYGETAEQMGTSVNAVTMLLHRGRKRLRQTLGVTTGGLGLWRWVKRAGLQQAALAKGTVAAVVAAGLAATGVVAARVVVPRTTAAADGPAATRLEVGRTSEAARAHGSALPPDTARRRVKTAGGSRASTATTPASGSTAPATSPSSTTDGTPPPLTLGLPAVSLPLAIAAPTTISTTVDTPITTVTTPTNTTATVTTPIVTVTVPIP